MLAFWIRLPVLSVTLLAKNVHGKRAAKLNAAYGKPSEFIFARFPKMMVNTMVLNRG